MIDLQDLMTHTYSIDAEDLDSQTKLLTFIHQPGDYQGEFTINQEQLVKLRYNIIKLEKLLTIK